MSCCWYDGLRSPNRKRAEHELYSNQQQHGQRGLVKQRMVRIRTGNPTECPNNHSRHNDSAGAVSKETAEAMAVGAHRRSGSTYALSVTGVAGPGDAGEAAPVGTVYVGLADANGCRVAHRQFLGDRDRIRQFTTQMALDLLRRRILGL